MQVTHLRSRRKDDTKKKDLGDDADAHRYFFLFVASAKTHAVRNSCPSRASVYKSKLHEVSMTKPRKTYQKTKYALVSADGYHFSWILQLENFYTLFSSSTRFTSSCKLSKLVFVVVCFSLFVLLSQKLPQNVSPGVYVCFCVVLKSSLNSKAFVIPYKTTCSVKHIVLF